MLITSKLESLYSFNEFSEAVSDGRFNPENITHDFLMEWISAEQKAAAFAENAGLSLSDFDTWNGVDFSVDFYRLRNAEELALRDISPERMHQYSLLASALSASEIDWDGTNSGNVRYDELFKYKFRTIFEVLHKFSNGLPSDYFLIDFKSGEIKNLAGEKHRLGLIE